MPALAVRLAARRTKVFSVARAVVVLPAARSRRARAVPKGAADRRAADRRVVARLAVVGPPVVAEPRAVVVLSVAAVLPVVAPRVVCLTPEAVPLAAVRAVIPLPAVAAVVAAAVE
jgi:hypothetical protein